MVGLVKVDWLRDMTTGRDNRSQSKLLIAARLGWDEQVKRFVYEFLSGLEYIPVGKDLFNDVPEEVAQELEIDFLSKVKQAKDDFIHEARSALVSYGFTDDLEEWVGIWVAMLLIEANLDAQRLGVVKFDFGLDDHAKISDQPSEDVADTEMIEGDIRPTQDETKEQVTEPEGQQWREIFSRFAYWDDLTEEERGEVLDWFEQTEPGIALSQRGEQAGKSEFRRPQREEHIVYQAEPEPEPEPSAGIMEYEQIDPQEIYAALDAVVEAKWPEYRGKTGRRPVRVERLKDVIRGRENEWFLLDEYAGLFIGTKNPRKEASSAISWVNAAFEGVNINLRIEGRTKNRRSNSALTRYRFCRIAPE